LFTFVGASRGHLCDSTALLFCFEITRTEVFDFAAFKPSFLQPEVARGVTWSVERVPVAVETSKELDQDVGVSGVKFVERESTGVAPDVKRVADSFTHFRLAQTRRVIHDSNNRQRFSRFCKIHPRTVRQTDGRTERTRNSASINSRFAL